MVVAAGSVSISRCLRVHVCMSYKGWDLKGKAEDSGHSRQLLAAIIKVTLSI